MVQNHSKYLFGDILFLFVYFSYIFLLILIKMSPAVGEYLCMTLGTVAVGVL